MPNRDRVTDDDLNFLDQLITGLDEKTARKVKNYFVSKSALAPGDPVSDKDNEDMTGVIEAEEFKNGELIYHVKADGGQYPDWDSKEENLKILIHPQAKKVVSFEIGDDVEDINGEKGEITGYAGASEMNPEDNFWFVKFPSESEPIKVLQSHLKPASVAEEAVPVQAEPAFSKKTAQDFEQIKNEFREWLGSGGMFAPGTPPEQALQDWIEMSPQPLVLDEAQRSELVEIARNSGFFASKKISVVKFGSSSDLKLAVDIIRESGKTLNYEVSSEELMFASKKDLKEASKAWKSYDFYPLVSCKESSEDSLPSVITKKAKKSFKEGKEEGEKIAKEISSIQAEDKKVSSGFGGLFKPTEEMAGRGKKKAVISPEELKRSKEDYPINQRVRLDDPESPDNGKAGNVVMSDPSDENVVVLWDEGGEGGCWKGVLEKISRIVEKKTAQFNVGDAVEVITPESPRYRDIGDVMREDPSGGDFEVEFIDGGIETFDGYELKKVSSKKTADEFPGGFEGCVKHFTSDPDFKAKHAGDTKEEGAQKLCAYIKEQKYGKGKTLKEAGVTQKDVWWLDDNTDRYLKNWHDKEDEEQLVKEKLPETEGGKDGQLKKKSWKAKLTFSNSQERGIAFDLLETYDYLCEDILGDDLSLEVSGTDDTEYERMSDILAGHDYDIFLTGSKKTSEIIISKDGAWENLPEGWDRGSLEKYWKSLTGDVKHKVTRCIRKIEDEGDIDDAGAFCASLADKMEPGWRSKK